MSERVEGLRLQLSLARGFAEHAPMEALARAEYVEQQARFELDSAQGAEREELEGLCQHASLCVRKFGKAFEDAQRASLERAEAFRARELAMLDAPLPPKPLPRG